MGTSNQNHPRVKIRSYKDLILWRKAMDLCEGIYATTSFFPKEERFGLTSQLRRAAFSITANIAEGWGRQTRNSFRYFLRVSQGSAAEVETGLLLADRLHFAPHDRITLLLDRILEVQKMLRGLLGSLERVRVGKPRAIGGLADLAN